MLGDTTSLTGDNVRIADIVQQRSLTVVHVTHHGHYRGTLNEIGGIIILLADGLYHLGTGIFGLKAKLVGNDIDRLGIESLVDAYHHAQIHTSGDNLVDGHVHHDGEVVSGNELGKLQDLALCCCQCSLLAGFLTVLLTFLATTGSGSLLVALGGEASQRLFHLALNILLAHLGPQRFAVALLVLAALAFVLAATAALARLRCGLVACGLDIDFFLADAFAFLLATLGLSLGDTLIAFLLFALLAGPGLLVNGGQVHLAHHLELRSANGLRHGLEHILGLVVLLGIIGFLLLGLDRLNSLGFLRHFKLRLGLRLWFGYGGSSNFSFYWLALLNWFLGRFLYRLLLVFRLLGSRLRLADALWLAGSLQVNLA